MSLDENTTTLIGAGVNADRRLHGDFVQPSLRGMWLARNSESTVAVPQARAENPLEPLMRAVHLGRTEIGTLYDGMLALDDRLRELSGVTPSKPSEPETGLGGFFGRKASGKTPEQELAAMKAALRELSIAMQPLFQARGYLDAHLCRVGQAGSDAWDMMEGFARDPVTGLISRVMMESQILPVLEREAEQRKEPLSFILIDFDHLKKANENGLMFGNAVLREVGTRLQKIVGEDCFLGRLGGDEYLLALPGKDVAFATQLAEELRQAAEAAPIVHEGVTWKPTVSLGVAEREIGESYLACVGRAEEGLKNAKTAGRNRAVCVHSKTGIKP